MGPSLKVNKHGLVELNISASSAAELPTDLYNFIRVEAIHARDNQIRELAETIGNLRRLQVLDLRNNKLTFLPASIVQCDKLRYLDVAYNNISDMPSNFATMKVLKYLSIGGNNIRYFGEEITSIRALEYLDISHNKLQVLPHSIQDLSSIRVLDLSYNNIADLPSHVCKLKQLQVLDLKYNNLNKLPCENSMWPNMKELNLTGNAFQQIPPALCSLKNLFILSIANNTIKQATGASLMMRKLKHLCLDSNQLNSLSNLPPSLEFLSVNDNNLRVVTLQGLTGLEYVDCSKNQIEYLPIGLEDCHSLKTLLLKSNCIREVPADTCHLPTLEVVDLGDNLLEKAPPVNFTKNLQLFNVQGNKFNKGAVNRKAAAVLSGAKADIKGNSLGASSTTPATSRKATPTPTGKSLKSSSARYISRARSPEVNATGDTHIGGIGGEFSEIPDTEAGADNSTTSDYAADTLHIKWTDKPSNDEFVLTPIGGRFTVPQTNICIEFSPGVTNRTVRFTLKAEMHFSRMLSAFQSDPQCSSSVKCIHYLSPLIHVNLNDNLNGDRQPIRIHIPLPETAGYLYLMMLGRDGFQLKLADSNNQKQQSVVTINCQIADLYSAIGVIKASTDSVTNTKKFLDNFFNAIYS